MSETEQTMRGELIHQPDAWLVICADPSCCRVVYLDAGMTKRAVSNTVVYQGWRKVDGLYRCPEHVRKEQAA